MEGIASVEKHLGEMPSEELMRLRDGLNALAESRTFAMLMDLVDVEAQRLEQLVHLKTTTFNARGLDALVKDQAERANLVGRRQGVGLPREIIEIVGRIADRVEAAIEREAGDV